MAGHKFQFTETVPLLPGAVDSAALGVDGTAGNRFTDKDVNKLVKLAADNNYVLPTAGDDIEGLCVAVETHTVNNGFSFGSVQKRFLAQAAIVKTSTVSVGSAVVADTQETLGTPQEYPYIKAGTGSLFKWRVKSLLDGTGQTGELVLIEPITR